MSHRHLAGVTVPLFSLRSQQSWGIGEIGDLPELAQWVHEAGIRLIHVLPLGTIADDETSPYSAMTAFGIDPMYISVAEVADVGDDLDLVLGGAEGASAAPSRGLAHHRGFPRRRALVRAPSTERRSRGAIPLISTERSLSCTCPGYLWS